jgi:hypothetical protein
MRLSLYVFKKIIGDCVGRQDESIGNPLDLPIFWLDNILTNIGKASSLIPEIEGR